MLKEKILTEIKINIKRDGVNKLIKFLEESDFFTAPASINHHGAEAGGLAKHSYEVFLKLFERCEDYNFKYSKETMVIAGLLHDICKVNYYKEGGKPATSAQKNYLSNWYKYDDDISKKRASQLIEYFKNGGSSEEMPKEKREWSVEDSLPLGHGEKSVYIIQHFFELSKDEALAIRWHMGMTEPGTHFNYPLGYAYQEAVKQCKLITLLHIADLEVSNILGY